MWGEKQNYGRTVMGVIRSTFVVDENGLIEHALYNVKATGHVARIRKLVGLTPRRRPGRLRRPRAPARRGTR